MPEDGAALSAISKGIGFLKRQQRDWKVTVARTTLSRFSYYLIFPYHSIYTVALGATATQVGIVNSAGLCLAGVLSPFAGWLIDRTGTKPIYLIGIGLLIISYLTYGVAQSWVIIILAMMAYQLGEAVSIQSCAVVCGNSLANEDRATGMGFCETFAMGLMTMAGPMLGAWLVTTFGGVNVSGIRPLFFVSLAISVVSFLLIRAQLSNRRWASLAETGAGFFKDLSQVFKQGRSLKRWLVIVSITWIPYGTILPFTQVFAYEVKGAEQYILGAMVTGMALTSLVLGIPLGRLADRIGRKKTLYLMAPLFYASNLLLIWAPNAGFLIAAGVLQGFFMTTIVATAAMSMELVPPEQMGRWLGTMRGIRLLVAAAAALLAGVIWDNIGPEYLFLTVIGLDLFIRIPLLIGMPETRWLKIGAEKAE